MLVVDPKTNKLSFLEDAGARGTKYLGMCAVPDRRLCCAPNNATPVLVVDPKIDKLSFLESGGAVGSKCGGICAGSDWRLYCLCMIYVLVLVLLLRYRSLYKPCVFVVLFLGAEGVA